MALDAYLAFTVGRQYVAATRSLWLVVVSSYCSPF